MKDFKTQVQLFKAQRVSKNDFGLKGKWVLFITDIIMETFKANEKTLLLTLLTYCVALRPRVYFSC